MRLKECRHDLAVSPPIHSGTIVEWDAVSGLGWIEDEWKVRLIFIRAGVSDLDLLDTMKVGEQIKFDTIGSMEWPQATHIIRAGTA